MTVVAVAVLTFLVAWVATGLARRHALRHAILDIPNVRSSHVAPTPRGGGLAIVAAFLGALVILVVVAGLQINIAFALIAGGGAIALTGYLDDRKALPASIRICIPSLLRLWRLSSSAASLNRRFNIWGCMESGQVVCWACSP